MTMTRKKRQTGFTLMELLVAMSLMVVASACLYSSLYTGFRAREAAEKVLIPLQAVKIAMDMIKQDLRGAVVGPDEDPNVLAGPFLGEDDRTGANVDTDVVTFFSSHHEINGDEERITCGIGLIEFSLVEPVKEDTYTLVRYVTDNLQTEDEQEPVEEVLCRNVKALNFRYYDGLRWYEEWDSTEQLDALPMAVEVTLEMEPHKESSTASSQKQTPRSRYDQDYLDACTRLTQVFVLPMASPMEAVEAAVDAAEEAEEAAASEGAAGPGGGGP
jgi:type II secretion system protein J